MKAHVFILISMLQNSPANAEHQISQDPDMVMEILAASAAILLIFLAGHFILSLTKRILDHRLKKRFIELGGNDSMLEAILQPTSRDDRNAAMKSFLLFCGAALGLVLVALFPPFGVHSLMIMSFCLSLSFLAYYFYLDRNSK